MGEENEYFFDPNTQLCGTFDDQALEIWNTIRLTLIEKLALKILCRDLRKTFDEIWPGCKIKAFGSVITNLAFKNSDMDFFIALPAHCEDDTTECLRKTMVHVVREVSAFEYVSSAPLARVPVITLKHVDTDRNCDITFLNSVAVETTTLIKYLLRLDIRAFKLAVLIKYWSKIYELTTTKRLPNHAITLLVIFYLQQRNILPSIAILQKNVGKNMTEGWNTSFEHITHESDNIDSLYELLGDFFVYYSNFNFGDFVVCPYLGYPVRRHKFINVSRLPTAFRLYKERVLNGGNTLMLGRLCVQDPFEHNHNCAVHVDGPLASKIKISFIYAASCFFDSLEFWIPQKPHI